MLFDHDPRQPVVATILDANVVALDSTDWALKAEFEVEADAWQPIQDRFDAEGVPGGFSFSATVPQATPPSGQTPLVVLAADAAAWTDLDREKAGAILNEVAPTSVARLFQYSGVELATIYFILGNVGLSVLGSAAYDAIKYLIAKRDGSTRIEIHRQDPDGTTAKAIVITDNPDIAQEALETLKDNGPSKSGQHFDAKKHLWLDY